VENILDSSIEKKTNVRIIDFVPAFLVLLLLVWSIFQRVSYNLVLNSEDYFAFGWVFICFIAYFINKKLYIFGLAIIFVVGLFNYVAFSPKHWHYTFSIVFNFIDQKLSLTVQPVSTGLLFIHLIIFRKKIDNSIKTTKESKLNAKENEVDTFKSKFTNMSRDELETIAKGNGYREEAIIAAKELLEKNKR
jgi:hypothetical protein